MKAEAHAAAKSMLEHPERGALVYGEGKNKRARRVRLMHVASSGLMAAGFIGIALITLVAVFIVLKPPIYLQVVGGLLVGVFLYWAFVSVQDALKRRKALKPLKVYDLGVRLPMGNERDILRGRSPKYIPFDKIAVFYPNEGNVAFPYFVITLKDPEAEPIFVWKELIGNWSRFRKAVKEKMAVHRGWYFLEGEGPAFGGYIESDELKLKYGAKERPSELSWDAVEGEPKAHMKGLKNLALMTLKLRKGGKLKLLVSLGLSDRMTRNYRKYVNRFWKEPEEEEERWEEFEQEAERAGEETEKEA